MSIQANLQRVKKQLPSSVTLVAVSKTKPNEAILEAYESGHRIFGENKVQELTAKAEALPKDIEWHLIGHLQRNKVKYIAPFVTMIHAVDSIRLAKEINKRAEQNNRVIQCLIQIHIAEEDTKFGFDFNEAKDFLASEELKELKNIEVKGVMGMATFTKNEEQVKREFTTLKSFYDSQQEITQNIENCQFDTLSMGMSGDYLIAIEAGSTMVRVGSAIFGSRN